MSKITIYFNKDDDYWLTELRKYAKKNRWSVSSAIREILSKYFDIITTNGTDEIQYFDGNSNQVEAPEPIFVSEHKGMVLIESPKIDLATFEAQNMAKLNTNQNLEACIKEHTNNGEISCYMFDNAREYHPFCKKDCWTNKILWKERVRL